MHHAVQVVSARRDGMLFLDFDYYNARVKAPAAQAGEKV